MDATVLRANLYADVRSNLSAAKEDMNCVDPFLSLSLLPAIRCSRISVYFPVLADPDLLMSFDVSYLKYEPTDSEARCSFIPTLFFLTVA